MSKDGINQKVKVKLKDLFPIGEGSMLFLTKMVLVAGTIVGTN